MSRIKKIFKIKDHKKASFYIFTAFCASVAAFFIVKTVLTSERAYRKFLKAREIKGTVEIENQLRRYEREANGRGINRVLKKLASMDESVLSRDQKRRRYEAMGDINLLKYKNPANWRDKQFFFDLTVRFYRMALKYTDNDLQKNLILRRMAEVYMNKGEWAKALDMFRKSDVNQMLPEERWRLKLNMAECCGKLKKYYDMLQILDQVADEGKSSPGIWASALRQEAYLKFKASKDDSILKSLLKGATGGTDKKKKLEVYRDQLRQEALSDYEEIIKELPELNPEVSMAKTGILRIYVLERQIKKAYRLANEIFSSSASAREKARSFILMAQAEEGEGNIRKAIDILDKAYSLYQKTSLRMEILMMLYRLYKNSEIKEYAKAFDVARTVFLEHPEEYAVNEIMKDLMPGRNQLLTILMMNAPPRARVAYIDSIRRMLASIEKNYGEIWRNIKNDAYFITANLLYLTKKYKKTEIEIQKCLNTPGNSEKLTERIYNLDLMNAIAAKASPPIIAVRAKRYLESFPAGKNYREALLALLRAYYNMRMYSDAINVARKIYVDELNTPKKVRDDSYNKMLWLQTIGLIGECYQKNGENIRANKLIKAFNKQLMNLPEPSSVFLAWATIAADMNQLYEAERRIEVILPETENINKLAELYVAQYLLKLKIGKIRDFFRCKKLLEKIENSSKLDEKMKKQYAGKLIEGMLAYSFRHKREKEFNNLLKYALDNYGDELWPENWALKSLTPLFKSRDINELRAKHREIIKSGFKKTDDDKETERFIRNQLGLINNLVEIDSYINKLETERGLGNEQ